MSYANPNVLPSGTSFTQFQAGGASGHLERLIAANSAAELNPTTAATLLAAGGGTVGGLLAQGVYYVNFTETNGYGETTVSAESGSVTIAAQRRPPARRPWWSLGLAERSRPASTEPSLPTSTRT